MAQLETIAGETSEPEATPTVFAPAMLLRPRQLPWTVLALLVALLFARLGVWQLNRRTERLARNAAIAARLDQPAVPIAGPVADPVGLAYRHVVATGVFDYANEIIILNQEYRGNSGARVLTPLRIAGGDSAVLVDRGWLPLEQSAPAARAAYRGPATAEARGLLQLLPAAPSRTPPAPAPATDRQRVDAWLDVDLAAIQRQLPYPLLPMVIQQTGEPAVSTLPIPAAEPVLDEGPHLGYAVQWFTFATLGLAGYVVVFGRRPRAVGMQPDVSSRSPNEPQKCSK